MPCPSHVHPRHDEAKLCFDHTPTLSPTQPQIKSSLQGNFGCEAHHCKFHTSTPMSPTIRVLSRRVYWWFSQTNKQENHHGAIQKDILNPLIQPRLPRFSQSDCSFRYFMGKSVGACSMLMAGEPHGLLRVGLHSRIDHSAYYSVFEIIIQLHHPPFPPNPPIYLSLLSISWSISS